MNKVIELVSFLQANSAVILSGIGIVVGGLISVLTGVVALMMLIPGNHPQTQLQSVIDFLQKCVDFVAKFSVPKKPA